MATEGDAPAPQLTEKQLLKLRSQRIQRQQFMEFLLKQVAEVTYQYNYFENSLLTEFVTVRQHRIYSNRKK